MTCAEVNLIFENKLAELRLPEAGYYFFVYFPNNCRCTNLFSIWKSKKAVDLSLRFDDQNNIKDYEVGEAYAFYYRQDYD